MRAALALLLLCGCDPLRTPVDAGGPDAGGPTSPFLDGGTLRVAEWNIQFFGKADAGPYDDQLQAANVAIAVGQVQPDLMAFEEVCDDALFAQMLSTVKTDTAVSYASIVADNGSLRNPYPGYGGDWGQKTALIWRPEVATMVSGQLIFRDDLDPNWGSTFATRDPLELQLKLANGLTLWVIVVHLKAEADAMSYAKRVQASGDLKAYLDQTHPNDLTMVIGDFNDDLDSSISGGATPFANFLSDAASYSFPSKAFSDAHQSTTVDFGAPIDHHLINAQLFSNLTAGSPQVIHPSVSNYGRTTSDHYPTLVEYHFP